MSRIRVPKTYFFSIHIFHFGHIPIFFHRKKHQTQRNSRIPGDLFEFQATSSATTLVETAELRGVSLGDVVKSCWNKLIVETYTWWLLWWLLLLWWSSNISFRYYYGDHEYICTYILSLSYIVCNAVTIVTHTEKGHVSYVIFKFNQNQIHPLLWRIFRRPSSWSSCVSLRCFVAAFYIEMKRTRIQYAIFRKGGAQRFTVVSCGLWGQLL